MKKTTKIFLTLLSILVILSLGFILSFNIVTAGYNLDTNKLIDLERTIEYYDSNDEVFAVESNGNEVTPIEKIPKNLKNAFIAIEDKRFYSHKGIDYKALLRAVLGNIKSGSFKEGASTISQQLIKNTHLSSEKTLKRKMIEIKLAKQLEKKYSKNEILEKYLNTIYFGANCYGITCASAFYFNKIPEELSLNECAVLAGMVKAPSNYSPINNIEKCYKRKNTVLKEMYSQKYITKFEYEENCKKEISIANNKSNLEYLYIVKTEANKIIDASPYYSKTYKVFTHYDKTAQNSLNNSLNEYKENYGKSGIIVDKKNKIIAYSSNVGETRRQLGSVIKPVLVYGPAIDTGAVYSCSLLEDEKTDFNGYSPKNYNDIYYGKISVKESLAKSLNVCAVKLLNYTGIEKSLSYLNLTDIPITSNDNNLSIALGCLQKGATLKEITSSYGVFLNNGIYITPSSIREISCKNGEIIYRDNSKENKVFKESSTYIMNDMLKATVEEGTAKKLKFANFPIYAKTGTVGNENGNTDAYSISYTTDYCMGIWVGNKDNSYMDNSITGGSLPCQIALDIWENLYYNSKKPTEFSIPSSVKNIAIDDISYNEGNVILSDENSPERYKNYQLFTENNIPDKHSTRFSYPKTEKPEITLNNNTISIKLCLTEYENAIIYRTENGVKKEIYDTLKNGKIETFLDSDLKPYKEYVYSLIPYYSNGTNKYFGEEIIIEKIKTSGNIPDDDWINDFM